MIVHGGTDAGPRPRLDLSTNANPYGPSPAARAAMRVDIGPYPDPSATAARSALAEAHGHALDEVVVGAGATELIDRLVRVLGGPVLTETVTFGEYAAAAERHGQTVLRADREGFLAALGEARVAFVPSPGNPDGRLREDAWCQAVATRAAATGTTLVWDLAYAPMVPEVVGVPRGAVALHAPNKAHGCTGLRAGWLAAPAELAQQLRAAEVTWSVSAPGLAFLTATTTAAARAWVHDSRETLRADRDALASLLRERGAEVVVGHAPFVIARSGPFDDRSVARLRAEHGVKLRPTGSMGHPGWWRIAAPPAAGLRVLSDALQEVAACVR